MTRQLPVGYLPFVYGRKDNIKTEETKKESPDTGAPFNAGKQIEQLKKMLWEERRKSEYYRRRLRRAEEENNSLKNRESLFEKS